MKKWLLILIQVIVISVLLTGCSSSSSTEEKESEPAPLTKTEYEIFEDADGRKGVKYGETIVAEPIWNRIFSNRSGDDVIGFEVELNDKWGLMNTEGKIIVEPIYRMIEGTKNHVILKADDTDELYSISEGQIIYTLEKNRNIWNIYKDVSDEYVILEDFVPTQSNKNEKYYVRDSELPGYIGWITGSRSYKMYLFDVNSRKIIHTFTVAEPEVGLYERPYYLSSYFPISIEITEVENGIVLQYPVIDKIGQDPFFFYRREFVNSKLVAGESYAYVDKPSIEENDDIIFIDNTNVVAIQQKDHGHRYWLYNKETGAQLSKSYTYCLDVNDLHISTFLVDENAYVPAWRELKDRTKEYAVLNLTDFKEIILTDVTQMKSPSDGMIAVKGQNGKWGYIDYAGKQVIEFKYEDASDFVDGQASVIFNYEKKIIDKQGNAK